MIGAVAFSLCAAVAAVDLEDSCGAESAVLRFDLRAFLAEHPGDTVYHYDVTKFTTALQGLVNRDGPRLLLRYLTAPGQDGVVNLDDYWLEQIGWDTLAPERIAQTDSFEAVLDHFDSTIEGGVVLWDPTVPATANVAATLAGVEGWLPVRAESRLYREVVVERGLSVSFSLVGMFDGSESGSAKCDAYLWAMREYLEPGRCHPALMANYIDAYTQRPGEPGFQYPDLVNSTLLNRDYFIMHRAFFHDLSPWADEAPVDCPDQPLGTDRATLRKILAAQAAVNGGRSFTSIAGFVSWNLKYTNFGPAGGQHDPVHTEWEAAALFSAYDAYKEPDALGYKALTNASALSHYPLAPRLRQNPRPRSQPLEHKTYVLIYMGDYDASAWLSREIPAVWDDPARGALPIAWAFNPNLAERVPYVFAHIYRTKSANDWFIAGNSGAGYLNPNLLTGDRLQSGLPDALDRWVAHNKTWFERFDYSITGFVIDGFHGPMNPRVAEAYASFSPHGVGTQYPPPAPVIDGVPFLQHAQDIYPDLRDLDATALHMNHFCQGDKPRFVIFRMILQRPSTVLALRDRLREMFPERDYAFVDPYTFFDLYARANAG